jgi:hypothetical protein
MTGQLLRINRATSGDNGASPGRVPRKILHEASRSTEKHLSHGAATAQYQAHSSHYKFGFKTTRYVGLIVAADILGQGRRL